MNPTGTYPLATALSNLEIAARLLRYAGAMQGPAPKVATVARRPGWIAASAGLAGVVLGAVAVMLGQGSRPPAPAPVVTPHVVAVPDPAPTLADAVAQTRASVVSLRTPTGAGAGVIVDPAGWVVTNLHVVGDAAPGDGETTVRARFANGRELAAVIVVADRDEDLAVLRLVGDEGELFAAATMGESAALRVGESVFAIGNPRGLSHSVSAGIVSAVDRPAGNGASVPLLQLDASINVGNSGGPLFTLDGRLVGLVAARDRAAEGIAFALPIDHVHGFLRAVTDAGGRRSGALGIQLGLDRAVPPSVKQLGYEAGLVVAQVLDGGAAAKAGLRDGDVVVEVRGARLDAMATEPAALGRWFIDSVRATFPGERLELALVRDGEVQRLAVEMGAASDREQAFIDAEVVLGVQLDRKATRPTVVDAVGSRGLGRYGPSLRGSVVVGLLGRDVADLDGLGSLLGELRAVVRRGKGDLIAWIRLREPSGHETVLPITIE